MCILNRHFPFKFQEVLIAISSISRPALIAQSSHSIVFRPYGFYFDIYHSALLTLSYHLY